jgi:hypothetical protein
MILSPLTTPADTRPANNPVWTTPTLGATSNGLGLRPFGRPRGLPSRTPPILVAHLMGASDGSLYQIPREER